MAFSGKDLKLLGLSGGVFIFLLLYGEKAIKAITGESSKTPLTSPTHVEPMTLVESLVMSYQDCIRDYCKVRQIEPALISAMIDIESQGRENLVTKLWDNREAYGLMQVTEKRAKTAFFYIKMSQLLEGNFNVFIGVSIMYNAIKKYGNVLDALAFYDAEGPFVTSFTTGWENWYFISQVCLKVPRYRLLWKNFYADYDTRFHIHDEIANFRLRIPSA